MILARFMANGGPRYGAVDGDRVSELRQNPFEAPPQPSGVGHRLQDLRLLAPCTPSKIVLVSGSYKEVIRAFNKPFPTEPLIFLKPSTAIIGPEGTIRWPRDAAELTHEPELAVVIGRPCREVPSSDADRYVLGYTCLNDVSAWDILQREVQFTRCKGYDTFAPTGPFIVDGVNPDSLGIRSYVNGHKVLESSTSDMVFRVREMVSFISRCMTLLPGDVISTGASGVAPLQAGDVVEIEIDGVGKLSNRVVREPPQ